MFSFHFEKQIPYVKRGGIRGFLSLTAENISDLLVLNFLFVLTSLPIVTAGASYCALCDVCLSLSKDEVTYIYSRYFSSFKKHLLKGSALGIFSALLLFIITFSFVFYLRLTKKSYLFYPLCAVCISCLIAAVCTLGQIFPIYVNEQASFFKSVKYAFYFSFAYIKQSALYLLLFVLLFFPIFAFFPYTVVLSVFPWSFLSLCSCFILTQNSSG